MDLNEYLVILMARERMAEAQAAAARDALLRAARPARRPARVQLGLALIRFGRWILGAAPTASASPAGR
jgi:hypothetical protein